MRNWFQNPRQAAGTTLLAFSLVVFWVNGGESIRPALKLDDGFALTSATPALGASRPEPGHSAVSLEEMGVEFDEDLPRQPALVAYAVTDTLMVAAAAFAIFGLNLLRRPEPGN